MYAHIIFILYWTWISQKLKKPWLFYKTNRKYHSKETLIKPFQLEKYLKILSYASCFHQAFFQLKYSNIIHDHIIAQRHSHNFLFVNYNTKCNVYHMFDSTSTNSTNCSLLSLSFISIDLSENLDLQEEFSFKTISCCP